MISPELLRRYHFFSHLSHDHLKAIAMLANEVLYETDAVLFQIDGPAEHLYFLMEGSVDLHFVVEDPNIPAARKDFFVGQISPGESVGISALIAPYVFSATAQANSPCRVLEFEAGRLRELCEGDPSMAAILMRHAAEVAMARLHETRIQLVTARA